ncbi:hypothetical protein Gohar_003097, partial [Gossypium harknessii]|nr:hypothetical protein [Gossypium harknessii]
MRNLLQDEEGQILGPHSIGVGLMACRGWTGGELFKRNRLGRVSYCNRVGGLSRIGFPGETMSYSTQWHQGCGEYQRRGDKDAAI